MDIDDFLDINQPLTKRVIPISDTVIIQPQQESTIVKARKRVGRNFSEPLKKAQEAELVARVKKLALPSCSSQTGATDVESVICAVNEEKNARITEQIELYNRYAFNPTPFNPSLPVHGHRGTILTQIRKSPVLVIKGDTGCGKSTQVPQFILDDSYNHREYCNIVVTQPRRIAAVALAEQVSKERGYEKNTLVAYQIGLDKQVSVDTRITYCTTGVLLEKVIQQKCMNMYTHIILDEIHERDEDMEFLLIAIKRFMIKNPFETKIILMSATIDTLQFSKYFRLPCPSGGFLNAPTLSFTEMRQYSVGMFYLEDLRKLEVSHATFHPEKPGIEPQMYRVACTIVASFSKPEFIVNGLCFLMFLPGFHEIAQMARTLQTECERVPTYNRPAYNWNILPLHSIISSEEQRRIFVRAAPNSVKIILATNIAESSITVPDVKFIVDFCLTRTLEVSQETGFSMLRLKWASKNSCTQRSGRAGRTSDGRCYRLVPRDFYEKNMPTNETPALVRCSLEKIVLKAKKLDSDVVPAKIIGLAIEPPDLTDIQYAIMNLKEARGLHLNVGGRYVKDDGDLTFLGKIMECLPLDIRATRLIAMGYLFNVLDECIIIAAGLTVQKVFSMNFQEPMKTYIQKLIFADGSGSDLIALLHAYQFMIRKLQTFKFDLNEDHAKAASRLCLDMKGIYEMYHLVDDVTKRLRAFRLESNSGVERSGISQRHLNLILKVCIAGGFYPNYFLRASCLSRGERERQIFHDLNGRDPTNTVFYRGIGTEELGMLYEDQVKSFLQSNNIVKSKDDVVVSFDEGSQKMFVTFMEKQDLLNTNNFKDTLPGSIKSQLYKSIKLTRERKVLRLNVLEKSALYTYGAKIGLGTYENGVFVPKSLKPKPYAVKLCCLPGLYENEILGRIVSIQTPNKFWIKPIQKQDADVLKHIKKALTDYPLDPIDDLENVVGQKVAVELERGIFRAKVMSKSTKQVVLHFKVFLFDEGVEEIVTGSQLKSMKCLKIDERHFALPKGPGIPLTDVPPRIFEASLAEIRPSYMASQSGKWTPEAISEFRDMTDELDYGLFEIYSLWNGVVSVTLYGLNGKSVNQHLIDKQLAQACEESYPSKYDHALRYKAQHFSQQTDKTGAPYQEIIDYLKEFAREPIKPPDEKLFTKSIVLRGPVSPLETSIHSTIRCGFTKTLSIERFSVNSVLLDTDPQDPTDRLVVAASCGSDISENTLILRNTTIMPNIRGFGALMAMVFAPKVEMHTNDEGTRYNSILCGLGYNPKTKKGYFEEHDFILNLDCSIDDEDLLLVNKIRYSMSSLLHTNEGENIPNHTPSNIKNLKSDLIINMMRYLNKQRQLLDIRSHSITEHKWGLFTEKEMAHVPAANVYEDRAIFPSFTFKKLEKITEEQTKNYRENNEELHQIAFCHLPIDREVKCHLCSKIFTSAPEIQVHLFTKLHKDRTLQCNAQFDIDNFIPDQKKILNETTSLYSDF